MHTNSKHDHETGREDTKMRFAEQGMGSDECRPQCELKSDPHWKAANPQRTNC